MSVSTDAQSATSPSNAALAVSVKYVFLDIVNFTRDRSVEAQTDLVHTMNQLVKASADSLGLTADNVIFLPAGDGICIAIVNKDVHYDVHIQLSLTLLGKLHEHNQTVSDKMRQFQIRIGINENIDNVVMDINGSKNVAGAGINHAQRLMNLADGNQVIVGTRVFEALRYRERYMKSFRKYSVALKHGLEISAYQLCEEGHPALAVSVPSQFAPPPTKPAEPLSLLEAYYLGFALKHRAFLTERRDLGQHEYAAVVLVWYLAGDAVAERERHEFERSNPHIYGKGELSIDKVYEYYVSIDFWVCCDLAYFAAGRLHRIRNLLEGVTTSDLYIVNKAGRKRLFAEHPEIIKELQLSSN